MVNSIVGVLVMVNSIVVDHSHGEQYCGGLGHAEQYFGGSWS